MEKVLSNERVIFPVGDVDIEIKRYIIDGYQSRKKKVGSNMTCEYCRKRKAVDRHHIESSYRGARKHYPDGSDLCCVCRKCHQKIESKNNFEKRQELKELVQKILKEVNSEKIGDFIS